MTVSFVGYAFVPRAGLAMSSLFRASDRINLYPAAPISDRRRLVVLPFLAFEAPYFIFFLKYLLASSLNALPAVKRGCRVAGLALKVVGSPVNGLVPLRDLVAFL